MEAKKQYYGDREIESISNEIEGGLYEVVFKDKTKVELSKGTISACVTDVPLDATSLRDKRCFPIVSEILKLFLEENVHIKEIDFICDRVIMSINESCKLGNAKLWGASEQDQTMAHVQRVLMSGDVLSPIQKV